MTKPPAREQAQVNIRMPDDLRDRIKVASEANNRSMNAEIVATLEREYPQPRDTLHLYIDHIRKRLDEYEQATEPRQRLFLQTLIEGMAAGHIEPLSMSEMEQRADQRSKK